MLEQMVAGMRARFPAVLTWKYAADEAVISLLRARTLGNSPTAMANNIREAHSQDWLKRALIYLDECARHKRSAQAFKVQVPTYR